jgi:CubicO group peptidase (beta-lactamase class C family)
MRALLSLFACLPLLACGDSTGLELGSVTLSVLSGDGQTGFQNTLLGEPVIVEAIRGNGDPLVGAGLTAIVNHGGGRVVDADAVTDEQGRASVYWELGEDWDNALTVALADRPGKHVVARAWALYVYEAPEETQDGWETASLGAVGMDEVRISEMMDRIRAGMYEEVHSVVIIKDGQLVFEEYFPGHDFGYNSSNFHGALVDFDRTTRHNTHSATKSVVSALVGLAIDRGLIPDENEPIFSFFDDYAGLGEGGKEAITIKHLLTMTSGLEWHEWDAPVGGGQNDIDGFNRSQDPTYYVLSKPLIHVPGTVFNYNGGTVNVLCRIVEAASGMTADRFARDFLFGHMGVTNYNFPRHRTGDIVCHGDIYITPRDMAKFGSLFLNGGVWQGTRILSEDWVQRSVTAKISLADWHLGWADEYGYLWWTKEYFERWTGYPSFKALGWGGQEIMVFPGSDLVVVFTGANYTQNPPCDEMVVQYILPALPDGGA